VRSGTFIGLILAFPCPWYMFAVGGLLPLPVIVLYGLSGGVLLAVSLVHLAAYTGVFYFVARRVRQPLAAAAVQFGLLAISFVPIYGSGENLASGGKLNRNAYQAYAEAFAEVFGRTAHDPHRAAR
jgi:hypothetical protein